MQNMIIAAESLNVGSGWLGFAPFGLRNPPPVPERNKNVVNYIR
jgi:hypothetical protein